MTHIILTPFQLYICIIFYHNLISKPNGINYFAREIELNPSERLYDFICEIAEFYYKEKDEWLKSFPETRDYNSFALNRTIYKL